MPMILCGETSVMPVLRKKRGTFYDENRQLYTFGLKGAHVSFMAQMPYGLWCMKMTKDEIRKVRQVVSLFQRVAIHSSFIELSLLSAHPGIRKIAMEENLAHLRIAQSIGAETVHIHAGGSGEYMSNKEVDDLMRAAMIRLDQEAGRRGVGVCWEVGTGYFTPLEKFDLIRKLGLKHTGICLDTAHLVGVWKLGKEKQTLRTFPQFIERYGDLIWAMHISDWRDNPPKHTHGWHDHHMVGDGEIGWKELFRALVKAGFSGTMTMEYHPKAVKSREAYLKNHEYIRRLVRESGGEIL